MATEDISKLIERAAKIAAAVPENLQEAAFHRALDLLAGPEGATGAAGSSKKTKRRGKKSGSSPSSQAPAEAGVAELLDAATDRAKHPEVTSAGGVLERSLRILRLAEQEHGVDDLSSAEIAGILTKTFKLRTTSNAVFMALDRSRDFVHKQKSGQVTKFRLMTPGEQYLDSLGSEAGDAVGAASPRRRKKSVRKKKATKKKASKQTARTGARAKKRDLGPGALLDQLLASGFFATPRTINDVRDHADKKLARTFALNNLSTPLARFIRSGKLERDKNADGNYEYRAP